MCGIVGYIGVDRAAPILIDGLKRLEYRGYDSAGITVFGTEVPYQMETIKCKGRIAILEEKIAERALPGTVGIGHT
ncbi:MAG: glutamine--fructose-6-phosphate aminotransferase, partial [Clostridiales bacterium]|nr:glutamine--fructose-6-phosphate aminotransferase [Clostridiales bacterium]